jgi:hypothetical protein
MQQRKNRIDAMSVDTKKTIGLFVLVTWLSQLVYLYPLPEQSIDAFVQARARAFASDLAVVQPSERKEQYLDRMRHIASREIWFRWTTTLVTIVVGICAGVAMLRKWRASNVLLLASSLLYIGEWWLFIGQEGDRKSLLDLYQGMWNFAVLENHQASFLHRDVFLLGAYYLLSLLAVVYIIRRYRRPSPPS